ncbi:flippase [Clostridium sporogenes]|nr:flippase [Clostridium sporogenes]NFF99722.1 flippase [Clostridium sporogenes]NFG05821.1 flippase [Clostridium sporogenes]NFG49974.1 flippase [Clostridium sporogenes]NFP85477.1 flippase [Clostridium sporogenes]
MTFKEKIMKSNSLLDFKKAIRNGFLHIFGSDFINKFIGFGISIVLPRIISIDLFGQYTYAQTILNTFLLFQGLGAVSAILQYCSESYEEEQKLSYLKYGIKIGMISNLVISILILLFSIFGSLPIKGSITILLYLSAIPIFSIIFDIIQIYLRVLYENKKFGILNNANTLLYLIGIVSLGLLFSINGIILAKYISLMLTILLGIVFLKKHIFNLSKMKYPDKANRKEFLKFSIISSLTNAISQLLVQIDVILIGNMITDTSIIAIYKVATVIPMNMLFLPSSVMVFLYPYFAKQCNNKAWIKEKYLKLQKYLAIINGLISIICIIFAPLIIKIIFGTQYLDCINAFRILWVGYFIAATFKVPSGNILFSIKKVKVNLFNSIISGILNIVLDILLILKFGYNGAAIATVITFIISSVISNIYLYKYLND